MTTYIKVRYQIQKMGLCSRQSPFRVEGQQDYVFIAELILVKTLPTMGPSRVKTAITTTATKTRINAYSTKPWPFSFGANNMGFSSFLDYFSGRPRDVHSISVLSVKILYKNVM